MQSIALQMQGKQPGQQFIIQTAPADQSQGASDGQSQVINICHIVGRSLLFCTISEA